MSDVLVARRCVPAIQMEAQIEPHTVFSVTECPAAQMNEISYFYSWNK